MRRVALQATLLFAIVGGSLGLTSVAAALALRGAATGQLEVDTASRLRADYSSGARGTRFAALSFELVAAAQTDELALKSLAETGPGAGQGQPTAAPRPLVSTGVARPARDQDPRRETGTPTAVPTGGAATPTAVPTGGAAPPPITPPTIVPAPARTASASAPESGPADASTPTPFAPTLPGPKPTNAPQGSPPPATTSNPSPTGAATATATPEPTGTPASTSPTSVVPTPAADTGGTGGSGTGSAGGGNGAANTPGGGTGGSPPEKDPAAPKETPTPPVRNEPPGQTDDKKPKK